MSATSSLAAAAAVQVRSEEKNTDAIESTTGNVATVTSKQLLMPSDGETLDVAAHQSTVFRRAAAWLHLADRSRDEWLEHSHFPLRSLLISAVCLIAQAICVAITFGAGIAARPSAPVFMRIASAVTISVHIPADMAMLVAFWRLGPLVHRTAPVLLALQTSTHVLFRTPVTFVIGLSKGNASMPFQSRIAFLVYVATIFLVSSHWSLLTFLVRERGPPSTPLIFCSIYAAKQAIRAVDVMSDLVLIRFIWDQVRHQVLPSKRACHRWLHHFADMHNLTSGRPCRSTSWSQNVPECACQVDTPFMPPTECVFSAQMQLDPGLCFCSTDATDMQAVNLM